MKLKISKAVKSSANSNLYSHTHTHKHNQTYGSKRGHAYLEGHLVFGHIAQDNEAFFLRVSRTEAELLCRAAGKEEALTVKRELLQRQDWVETKSLGLKNSPKL